MDSRITKKRLSNYLAYEWIAIIALCLVAIIVWELVYTVGAIRLTVGQQYKFYYDSSLLSGTSSELITELELQDEFGYENGKTFSFDVLKIDVESISAETDLLSTRLSVQEGDMLFTDCRETDEKRKTVLAKSRVDSVPVVNYEKLLEDAEKYLQGLLKDGLVELKYDNLDQEKIKEGFNKRLGRDNRFRTQEQKESGLKLEQERLEKLCKEVSDFKKIMGLDDYFFTYTKYTQNLELAIANENKNAQADYEQLVEIEKTQGRENAKYGLRVDKLTGGAKDPTKFFRLNDGSEKPNAKDIVIMVFDFVSYQPELQFESITVINNIVRACSTILD